MRMASLLAAALLAGIPASAVSQSIVAAAGARQVSVELREGGRVVAASNVRLQLGRPAAISMNGPFAMRLRVDALEGTGYTVRPNLTANGPAGWTRLDAPTMSVAPGQPGKAQVVRPSGPPLEIAVSVD